MNAVPCNSGPIVIHFMTYDTSASPQTDSPPEQGGTSNNRRASWVFSNEIREARGNLRSATLSRSSRRADSPWRRLYNPHSLIAVRLLSTSPVEIDREFLRARIADALALREGPLSGRVDVPPRPWRRRFSLRLVIDRFGDQFAVQTFAYGMELAASPRVRDP